MPGYIEHCHKLNFRSTYENGAFSHIKNIVQNFDVKSCDMKYVMYFTYEMEAIRNKINLLYEIFHSRMELGHFHM